MTLLEHDPISVADEPELDLLIREARLRQRRRRRRRALVILLAACCGYVAIQAVTGSSSQGPLLGRALRVPSLGAGGSCPVSPGTAFSNALFDGEALGTGPVRVLIANGGDLAHGRAVLGTSAARGWFALQTLWFAMPGYDGPFVVRGARVGKRGPIEVQPGGSGLTPGSGPLVVPAGSTLNSEAGYRTVPGSTWVKGPGCYSWQVDGRGFSENIVIDALAPGT